MSDYWLCQAGTRLRSQIDHRWPDRDKASDGWIGDPSHQATKSDHNPDWTSKPPGVVRAIDIDADLDPAQPRAARRLANQLIAYARREPDRRMAYIIYDHKIASGTYPATFWLWRDFTGDDPHTNHIHISFTRNGDTRGRRFDLPILETKIP